MIDEGQTKMSGLPCCEAEKYMLRVWLDGDTESRELCSSVSAWRSLVSPASDCTCAKKVECFPWNILEAESDFATTGFMEGFDFFAEHFFSFDGFARRTEEQMTAWLSGQESVFDGRPMLLSCLLRKGYRPTINPVVMWGSLEKMDLSDPRNPGIRFPLIAAEYLGELVASSRCESGGSWETLNLHMLHLLAWATAISSGSRILFEVDEDTWAVRFKSVSAEWIYTSFRQALSEFSMDFRDKTFLGGSEDIGKRVLRILHSCWKETRQSFSSREEYRNEEKAKLWVAVHDLLAEDAPVQQLAVAYSTPWFDPLGFLSVCLWGGWSGNEDIIRVLERGPQLLAQASVSKSAIAVRKVLFDLKSINCVTEGVVSEAERALCLRRDMLLGAVLHNHCESDKLCIADLIKELDEDRVGKNRFTLDRFVSKIIACPDSSS